MARVTGLGGAFLPADDPKALYDWYGKHLGIASPDGCFFSAGSATRIHCSRLLSEVF